jgi:hypothetical protein
MILALLILLAPLDDPAPQPTVPVIQPGPGPLTQGPDFPYTIPTTAGPPNCYPGQQGPC